MNALPFDVALAAQRLVAARAGAPVAAALVTPPSRDLAYAVQDATLAALGPIGGWKVGRKSASAEPQCAPLPSAGVLPSGATLRGPSWTLRGIEVEVALRLGRDIVPSGAGVDRDEMLRAIDSVMPAVEVVETRLAERRDSDPLAQLADLQSHGALVLGAPCGFDPSRIDFAVVEARLAFDGQPIADVRGGNPAGDVLRLLEWLALHSARRGHPLRAGDVITTGSCSGMAFAPADARVSAEVVGMGRVELEFGAH
jgi:2-keto-4-pentenoate hydratase